MNSNLDFQKVTAEKFLIKTINEETKKIINLIVDDFAIPYISGLSLETLSQADYAIRGGKGTKPAPFSREIKLKLYQKIHSVFERRLKLIIEYALNPVLGSRYLLSGIESLETLNTNTSLHEANFEIRNILSLFNTYINQNYLYDCSYLISAVQYETEKFIPDIYNIAQLNEVINST